MSSFETLAFALFFIGTVVFFLWVVFLALRK